MLDLAGPGVEAVPANLVLLIDSPLPLPSGGGRVINIRDLGADPTGVRDSTSAIQQALLSAAGTSAAKTGLVLVPAGAYMTTNTLLIGSNTTLFLEAGSVIRSTAGRNLLPPPSGSSCNGNLVALVSLAPGASAVTIMGLGRLDANGFKLMSPDVSGNCR